MNTCNHYLERQKKLLAWMEGKGIDAAVLHDTEEHRTASMRYLCGHPMDALFILKADGTSILVPWDVHLAEAEATADSIIPQAEFGRDPAAAIEGLLNGLTANSKIELSSATPHPFVSELAQRMSGHEIVCRKEGLAEALLSMRMIKDARETTEYERACAATDKVIDHILNHWDDYGTETDVALAIEHEGRKLGAEKTGFETIVSGPQRSWAIHAFPSFGPGSLKETGLTIIDFGLVFGGYTTDVTVTVARGALTPAQHEMISLVTEAHELAKGMLGPGVMTKDVASAVTAFFGARGKTMPHSLGHGIGLDIHEYPFLRDREEGNSALMPGMIITVEPGLYDPQAGGVRYENDYLITPDGAVKLTNSRILHIP